MSMFGCQSLYNNNSNNNNNFQQHLMPFVYITNIL